MEIQEEKGKWKQEILPCGLEFELEAWGGLQLGTTGSSGGGGKRSFNEHGKSFDFNLSIINALNQSTANHVSVGN